MSSEKPGLSIIERWFEFERMRKKSLDLLKDIELSNFSLQYGARTESEFRSKLKDLASLVSKMEAILGPETQPTIAVT